MNELSAAGLCAFGAGICFILVRFKGELPWAWMQSDIFQALLVLSGVVLAFIAAASGLTWLEKHASDWVRDIRFAWLAGSEKVAIVNAFGKLTPAQTEAVRMYATQIDVLTGEPGPVYKLITGTVKVPMVFVKKFLSSGDGLYLPPVRNYPDGTRERAWAEAVTAHLIFLAFAERAIGNLPAHWMDAQAMERGIAALGIKKEELS